MDAALLHPSKYIKAIEMKGKDVTVTIADVDFEEIEKTDKKKERKGMVSLKETPKGWLLNVTNIKCLIALFGRETDNWIGRRVTLYPEKNEMSETGVAIRVRGSPDIEKDISFILKLSKKKDRRVTLIATGKKSGNGHAKPPAAAQSENETGPRGEEPPEDLQPSEPLFPEEEDRAPENP